jgi:hypothetical protein
MPDEYDFDHLPINRADRVRMARDARRQERRREGMRARHAPDTHAVDRAISEAVARLATQAVARLGREAMRDPAALPGITLGYVNISHEAVDILCFRYNRAESLRAVRRRIRAHKRHLDPLPPERNQD